MKRDIQADRQMLAKMMGTTAYAEGSIAGILKHYMDRCEGVEQRAADAEMTAHTRGAQVADLERAIQAFCSSASK